MVSRVIGLFLWLAVMWEYALVAAWVGHAWCRIVRETPWMDRMWRLCARVHQELWILAGPALVAGAARDWRESPIVLFAAAINLGFWWVYRNWPEENRWRRRGRKAREAVARRGARLVVVPQ